MYPCLSDRREKCFAYILGNFTLFHSIVPKGSEYARILDEYIMRALEFFYKVTKIIKRFGIKT
jgi:hypothetical protein